MSLLSNVAALATEAIRFVAKLETGSMEGQIKRACFWGGLFAVVVIVLLGGIGLIIAGAWILLAPVTGAGLTGVILGIVVVIIAAALTIAAKISIK